MKTKYTNSIVELLTGTKTNKTIFNMWGGCSPVSMGDGIKFRVTKCRFVDYVYIRYLAGFDTFEVEYAALVGTEYDILDRVKPIDSDDLVKSIARKLFRGESVSSEDMKNEQKASNEHPVV